MGLRGSLGLNLFSSWVTHAVGLLIGVFLMPYVLHTLGDETYGTWILISSIAGYSGLLYLGFGSTVGRFVATHYARGEWDQLNRVVTVVFSVYLALGMVALALAGLVAWLAPGLHDWGSVPLEEVRLVVLILGLNVAAGLVGSVFGGVLIGVERFELERGLWMGSAVIRLGLTLLFLAKPGGLLTLSLIFLTVTLLENAGSLFFAWRVVPQLSIRPANFSRGTLKEIFSFSIFALIEDISIQLVYATDTVVIGFLLGAKAIVPYYIAQRLCQFLSKPIMQIGQVFMPRAGALQAGDDSARLQALVTRGMGMALLLSAGMLTGAAFFGQAVITTWVGPGYEASYHLLLLLFASHVIAMPTGVLRSVLFGMGHARVPALMYLAQAVANLGLTLLLIGPYGLTGVAIGTVVPVVLIELGALLPYALKVLRLDLRTLLLKSVVPQLLPLLVLAAWSLAVQQSLSTVEGWFRLVLVAGGGGIMLLGTWVLVNRNELPESLQRWRQKPLFAADSAVTEEREPECRGTREADHQGAPEGQPGEPAIHGTLT
ncbi:MAG: oligosaccharide flippase family protein [Planctomycetaceae bacterium]|nr:oligosaccharide flippase family protein [Planctomycetaceae bacterium]